MDAFGMRFPLQLTQALSSAPICFVCTELAVYDHDRLAAILGLKS